MRNITAIFAALIILFIFISSNHIILASHTSNLDTRRSFTPGRIIRPTTAPKILPTSTPTPTSIPKATPTLKPTTTPINSPSSDEKKDYMMKAINDYRILKGLSTVKTDPYTCGFAKTRAEEISKNFNHDGFTNRINNKTLPYPSYSQITENLAMNSNYKDVVNQWINSSGHAANMQKDTPYVCVEYYGNYYAYEGWKP